MANLRRSGSRCRRVSWRRIRGSSAATTAANVTAFGGSVDRSGRPAQPVEPVEPGCRIDLYLRIKAAPLRGAAGAPATGLCVGPPARHGRAAVPSGAG